MGKNESLKLSDIEKQEIYDLERLDLSKRVDVLDSFKKLINDILVDEFKNMYDDEDGQKVLDVDGKVDYVFRKYLQNCIKKIEQL